jgi:hypothetical protein
MFKFFLKRHIDSPQFSLARPRPLEEKASEIVLMACFKRKGGLSRSDISSETMRNQNLKKFERARLRVRPAPFGDVSRWPEMTPQNQTTFNWFILMFQS